MGEDKKPDNPKAFPAPTERIPQKGSGINGPYPDVVNEQSGMTLLDYFAAKAMQGICASPEEHSGEYDWVKSNVEWSYKIAKAMLKEREKHL